MTDGVSAMFDRLVEEERARKMEKFQQRSDNAKLASVITAIDNLNLFVSMEPALTRHQWALLDSTLQELQDLLK